MVKTLFYCSEDSSDTLWEVGQIVMDEISEMNLDTCEDIDGLVEQIKDRGYSYGVAILVVGTMEELTDLAPHSDHLRRVDTILIVPNAKENTLTMGHRLYPRFMTTADNAYRYLGPVLKNMIRRSERRRN